jgi:peptide deformylase
VNDEFEEIVAEVGELEADSISTSEIDEEVLRRRDEAMARIVQYGDPVLRSRASEIDRFDADLEAEAQEMFVLMRDAFGCGLAANQVGRLRRLLVFQSSEDEEPDALVNPVMESVSEETETMTEGCLSIPGVVLDVERPVEATFSGLDLSGRPVRWEMSGMRSRIIQHELDHLDGILILDRAPADQRRAAMRALRRGETWEPPGGESDHDDQTGEATI